MKRIIIVFLGLLLLTTSALGAEKAKRVDTDTTNFDGNLSVADTTVQAALETLDEFTSADLRYLKLDGTVSMTGDLDMATSDITADGDLKIVPDATGDLVLFGDIDVGDDVHGKKLIINRKAVEADDSFSLYIDSYRNAIFTATEDMMFTPENNLYFLRNPGAASDILLFDQAGSGDSVELRQYGYITADTSAKYIQWLVSDTTDNFELTREDSNIGAFDIQMPLITDGITASGTVEGATLTEGGIGVYNTTESDSAYINDSDFNTFAELQSQIADEVLLKSGTLTDAKYCTYNSASGDIICNSEGGTSITGTDTHVLFFDGANTPAGDAGMTYNKTTDTLTAVAFETTPSSTPTMSFKDSDATAGDVNASIVANCTDVGDGTEDCDMTLSQQIAGTDTVFITADADGRVTVARLSATSPIFVTPALGTPNSGVATNLTGTAASLTAGTVTTNANLTGDVTSSGNATDITESVLEDGGSDELAITAGMMNTGTNASSSTYWRGDNTWATPGGNSPVYEFSKTLEDPVEADDNIPFFHPKQAITITDVYCEVEGTTSIGIIIGDGTNSLEEIICDADGQADDGSLTNATFSANERMEVDMGTISGTPDWVSWSITYTID